MLGRRELAEVVDVIESRVRSGERMSPEALAQALAALDVLQDAGGSPAVAGAARDTQHWLSQYVAALSDGACGADDPQRQACLRLMTLGTCADLRVAIAGSWMGAA